jgi:AAA ATPase domain
VQVVRGLRRAGTPEEWAAAEVAGGKGLGVLLGELPSGAPDLSSDQGGEPVEAFQLYDAVTTALVSVSQRRPVVVVLDDLHWTDSASLRLLELVTSLRPRPIGMTFASSFPSGIRSCFRLLQLQ